MSVAEFVERGPSGAWAQCLTMIVKLVTSPSVSESFEVFSPLVVLRVDSASSVLREFQERRAAIFAVRGIAGPASANSLF